MDRTDGGSKCSRSWLATERGGEGEREGKERERLWLLAVMFTGSPKGSADQQERSVVNTTSKKLFQQQQK